MEELAGFLAAVGEFETGLTRAFGLRREDLPWLVALAESPDGLSRAELEAAARSADLGPGLDALRARGDLDGDDERLVLSEATRERFRAAYARVETAYIGLHLYGAEELGVVRTFLRMGRRFYEHQAARVKR